MLLNTSEAAATLTVGVDAFRNERKNVTGRPRVITGIIIVGANAINEARIGLYVGDMLLGSFRNSRAGVAAPIVPDDVQGIGNRFVAAGDKIAAIVEVAPTVSPLLIQVLGVER
jgi:hypothetical protein